MDPADRVKVVLTYVVLGVWAIVFLVALVAPPKDSTELLATNGVLMAVIGALFVDRVVKRNGKP